MPPIVTSWLEWFPFVCMISGGHTPPSGTKQLITKLMEAAVIGGIVLYGTVKVIETRLDYIEVNQTKLEIGLEKVSDAVGDLKVAVGKMEK